MGTYSEEVANLQGKSARKVANNTYLERLSDTEIGLRLHSTYVIRWHADGRIILNDGGWPTATTKDRIDRWLPSGLRLATDTDGAWAVYRLRAKRPNDADFSGYGFDGRRYFSGMVISEDGEILNPDARFRRIDSLPPLNGEPIFWQVDNVKTESGW